MEIWLIHLQNPTLLVTWQCFACQKNNKHGQNTQQSLCNVGLQIPLFPTLLWILSPLNTREPNIEGEVHVLCSPAVFKPFVVTVTELLSVWLCSPAAHVDLHDAASLLYQSTCSDPYVHVLITDLSSHSDPLLMCLFYRNVTFVYLRKYSSQPGCNHCCCDQTLSLQLLGNGQSSVFSGARIRGNFSPFSQSCALILDFSYSCFFPIL